MSYTRTTWRDGETPLSAGNFNNMEDGIEEALEKTRELLDFVYPVGSYFWTSDPNFEPATEWGGTWTLEDEGRVLVSAGETYIVDATGGEATHTMTFAEMPKHAHEMSAHRHSMGSNWSSGSGGFNAYMTSSGRATTEHFTGYAGAGATEESGLSVPFNLMQPYKAAYCWHRTA